MVLPILLVHGATTLGCRASGAALFIGLAAFALFSGQIADGFFPSPRDPHRASRRTAARVARWIFLAWGVLGALGGLMVLLGVLHCA